MHFFPEKYGKQVKNVILVLCAKLCPLWVKRREMRGLSGGGRVGLDMSVSIVISLMVIAICVLLFHSVGPKVARDIKWTKDLNKVFINNFAKYPDLSWQYFGSAEGIHRQYPGMRAITGLEETNLILYYD